jgi:hypothetical protein
MSDQWEKALSCAKKCANCEAELGPRHQRILSVYTHEPICMNCKRDEEKRPDYADVSKGMIGQCIQDTGRPYGDPAGYCFHHFCPFMC